MRVMIAFLFGLSLIATPSAAQTRKTLDIYLIDVEGGGATLFVAPSGETVLIDTGNGGGGEQCCWTNVLIKVNVQASPAAR